MYLLQKMLNSYCYAYKKSRLIKMNIFIVLNLNEKIKLIVKENKRKLFVKNYSYEAI